jgi:hypothetical protein
LNVNILMVGDLDVDERTYRRNFKGLWRFPKLIRRWLSPPKYGLSVFEIFFPRGFKQASSASKYHNFFA